MQDIATLQNCLRSCKCVGNFRKIGTGIPLAVHTENHPVARKCFTLMRKTFNIKTNIVIRRHPRKDNWNYRVF